MNTEAERIFVTRRITPEEATTLVGEPVDQQTPANKGPAFFYDSDTGQLVAAQLPLQNTATLRQQLMGMRFGTVNRAGNYGSKSTTFGYAPRRPVMGREGCNQAGLDKENPDIARELSRIADQCAVAFKDFAPNIVQEDMHTTREVLPEWRIGEQKLWTSGVVNHTAQLPYHRDNFNYPAWSAMPVLRRGTRGGHLHLPEYGITLPCQDGYANFFKGKELVHGVTPITRTRADGYRFSIVFYALQGMKDCFTHAVETEYAQRRRSEREREMARRIANGDTTIPGHTPPANRNGDPNLMADPDDAESCAEAADIAQARKKNNA